jgi:hypothetical protein
VTVNEAGLAIGFAFFAGLSAGCIIMAAMFKRILDGRALSSNGPKHRAPKPSKKTPPPRSAGLRKAEPELDFSDLLTEHRSSNNFPE